MFGWRAVAKCIHWHKIVICHCNYNKRPMGQIAQLSNLGPYRKYNMHFISICSIRPSGAHNFNQLAFVLCQKAFM
jgi:predicted metal-dependent phosphotriesterase family hydrolase